MNRIISFILSLSVTLSAIIVFSNISSAATVEPEDYFHYGFSSGYILGIPQNTSVAQLRTELMKQDEVNQVTITNANGLSVSGPSSICTNYIITISTYDNSSSSITNVFRAVIYGDISGDGHVKNNDVELCNNYLYGKTELYGAALKAADINGDNGVSLSEKNEIESMVGDSTFNGKLSLLSITGATYEGSPFTAYDSINSIAMQTLFLRSHYSVSVNRDSNIAETLSLIQNSTAFASFSHGAPNGEGLIVGDSNQVLTKSRIINLPTNALSNSRLIYYGACSSGYGGINGDNMVNATYNQGAKAVIGFKDSVNIDSAVVWTQRFLKSLGYGSRISQAMLQADYAVTYSNYYNDKYSTENRLVRGTTSQMLTQPISVRFSKFRYSDYLASQSNNASVNINTKESVKTDDEQFIGYTGTYTNSENIPLSIEKSDTEIKYIADEELSKYVDISKYNLYRFDYVEDTNAYYIVYNKIINNIPTDDIAFIMVRPDGNILALGCKNNGAFDDFDFSKINRKFLSESVNSERSVDLQTIKANTDEADIVYSFLAIDENDNYVMRTGVSENDNIKVYDIKIK